MVNHHFPNDCRKLGDIQTIFRHWWKPNTSKYTAWDVWKILSCAWLLRRQRKTLDIHTKKSAGFFGNTLKKVGCWQYPPHRGDGSKNVGNYMWEECMCRLGPKKISKRKYLHDSVEMWEKCTPLWREAHFQIKMFKNTFKKTPLRTTFWKLNVAKVNAAAAQSTFRSQKC